MDGLEIIGVATLNEAIQHLEGKAIIQPTQYDTRDIFFSESGYYISDFADVQ